MTEAELAELDDPDAPNEPTTLVGHRGSSAMVPVQEQRERRGTMSAALAAGANSDQLIASFAKQYGMTETGTRNLMREVRAMWDDDDSESSKYKRSAQERRLLNHIQKAVKAGKFTAVANLEKEYTSVSGTGIHEDDKPIDVDSRLTEAILKEIGAMDTQSVRIMIQDEKTFIELTKHDGTVHSNKRLDSGKTEIIDVKGV